MTFFGDKCNKGGNDYDIVQDIVKNGDGEYFSVKSPNETAEVLSYLLKYD